ncbi:MAG: hypothetical protein KGH75_00410 [Rhodospirillales bacterium]|nr:hypothetical protein [Rhodospirillales bacterium]
MRIIVDVDDDWADAAAESCLLPDALRRLLERAALDLTDRAHALEELSPIREPYVHLGGRTPTSQERLIGTYRVDLSRQADERETDLERLTGAVARGWCHPETEHLTMDVELAQAIVDEVFPLLVQARSGYYVDALAQPER